MPRIRTIKPEFWLDEKLSLMSAIDRLTFLGLISMADDYGRVHDNAKIIDAFVFPNSDDSVRESLANLSRISRIRRGNSSSGMPVIEIVNWARHQKVDKPQPKLALPPICQRQLKTWGKPLSRIVRESFANCSRIGRSSYLPTYDYDQGAGAFAGNSSSEEDSWGMGDSKAFRQSKNPDLLSQFEAMRASIKKPIKNRSNSSAILIALKIRTSCLRARTLHCDEYQGLKLIIGKQDLKTLYKVC